MNQTALPHTADPLSTRFEIETPEHVAVGYELAGPGSRCAAFIIDAVIVMVSVVLFGFTLIAVSYAGASAGLFLATGVIASSLFLLGTFGIVWGYFIYFEGMRDGQTPGKRRFGLRVVQEGGHPVTFRAAAIRNLIRFVDIQPFPSCAVGGLFILVHPRAQRPGDLAAGTIVVRERPIPVLPEEEADAGPPRLTDAEYRILHEYASRRDTLEPGARRRVAVRMLPSYFQYAEEEHQGWGGGDGGLPHPSAADAILSRIYTRESGRRSASGTRSGAGSPAAAALVRRQRDRWDAFAALLHRARERGLGALPESQVARFASLYREIAADLARARTYGASPALLYTLERSVATGHNLLYVRPQRSLRRAGSWLGSGFPALVRRCYVPTLLATGIFFGPALFTFAAVADDPARAHEVVPAEMIARAEAGAARQAAGTGYVEVPEIFMPVFSSQIIANNVQVSFMAFAGGILAGIGTFAILLLNGVMLGGVAGLFHAEGLNLYLWSFVLPHGVIELTAICLAGGAGLHLASGFVLPGRRTRRAALAERAREAVALLGGVVFLLLVAGLIEGFVSPSARLPDQVKLAVGFLTASVLFPWLFLGGRERDVSPRGGEGDLS